MAADDIEIPVLSLPSIERHSFCVCVCVCVYVCVRACEHVCMCVCFHPQRRRSSTRGGCWPSPASVWRCWWLASFVWWPTAKPSMWPWRDEKCLPFHKRLRIWKKTLWWAASSHAIEQWGKTYSDSFIKQRYNYNYLNIWKWLIQSESPCSVENVSSEWYIIYFVISYTSSLLLL